MAMMYLVIFSSLATAMAIVAQSNLATADSHQRINRALSGAETGMRFLIYRINQITPVVTTTDGLIDETNAPDLWEETRDALLASMELEPHNLAEPVVINGTLQLGPIALGPNDPQFTATLTPHPLAGEDYDNGYYQRPPFSNLAPPVSAAEPLDTTWVRVRVISSDGAGGNEITRSIQMDFHIDKKIRFAILSRSRVMIGQNVLIDGPIGSRFTETNLTNGHPIQMVSDFVGLDATLNAALDAFVTDVVNLDQNGDNRLNLADANEIDGIINPEQFDTDGDGYIDGYDFFLDHYDANADGQLTSIELDTSGNIHTAQLFELIDTFGDSSRAGYNDGVIDENTVGVLMEPIQGEGGVVLPPDGFLRDLRELCTRTDVLMAMDEIQAGLGRTGKTFASDHEDVVPDLYVLGKALGGGIVPVSAVVADRDVLGVLQPGQHGSTFGGNPLACAVGLAVVRMLATGEHQARAAELGTILRERLEALVGHGVLAVRVRGLWAGIDIDPAVGTGREVCEALMARGVLAKDTHGSTIRLAPPLVISAEDLAWGLDQLAEVVRGA